MAAIDTHRAPGFGATARIVNFVTAIGHRFADWKDARATIATLSKLSDHELEDIGLTRASIERIGQ